MLCCCIILKVKLLNYNNTDIGHITYFPTMTHSEIKKDQAI